MGLAHQHAASWPGVGNTQIRPITVLQAPGHDARSGDGHLTKHDPSEVFLGIFLTGADRKNVFSSWSQGFKGVSPDPFAVGWRETPRHRWEEGILEVPEAQVPVAPKVGFTP